VREKSFANPHREAGRRLWYATAIGTETFIADVICAQVEQARAKYPENEAVQVDPDPVPPIEIALGNFFATTSPPWRIGQVMIQPGYELRHGEDEGQDSPALREIGSPADLREWIRLDEAGNFRPLRSAPNLRRGWIYRARDLTELHLALDYLYPAELANWLLWNGGQLSITPWPETAARQTGRFRVVREIDDKSLNELVNDYCQKGCLKKRLWLPAQQEVKVSPGEVPLLCPEACNFLVGKAREKLKGPGDE
jgi:sirohydrochlorin cobaltochelatase